MVQKINYFAKYPTIPRMNTKAGIAARISGCGHIIRNLNLKIAQIQGASVKGLVMAGMYIQKQMDTIPPLVPVDTGALRSSFSITPKLERPERPAVEIGWPDTEIERNGTSVKQYAAYVHEMTIPPYENVNWSRPGSGPKFFETALKRNERTIVDIVSINAQKIV